MKTCVCVCVCACARARVCMYIYIYIYIYSVDISAWWIIFVYLITYIFWYVTPCWLVISCRCFGEWTCTIYIYTHTHTHTHTHTYTHTRVSQGENLKYVYLVIYCTQKVHSDFIFCVVSYCHLSATLQTISITVETYRQSSCGSNCYRTFNVFSWLSLVYRVPQEECAKLRESVPYVKVYRYNPKHLYPKLNG